MKSYSTPPKPLQPLECPCCGTTGAQPIDGMYFHGQDLVCGCDGCVEISSSTGPEIVMFGYGHCNHFDSEEYTND